MSEDRQLSQVTRFQDVVSTQANTVKWKLHNSQVVISFSSCKKKKNNFFLLSALPWIRKKGEGKGLKGWRAYDEWLNERDNADEVVEKVAIQIGIGRRTGR